MDLKEEIRDYFYNKLSTIEEDIANVIAIAEKHQTLQLQQTGVRGSNLQQYLVRYKKIIESPHPLLDDEIITVSKVVEVSNAIQINDLFKNIVDIKRIF
jgi:hypothetical protein